MGRTLKYDIPGTDFRCSVDEIRDQGWAAIFAPDVAPPLRVVVEIGFGRGEFLTHLAREDSSTAFVGVDISFKRVLKMARRTAASEIRNLRLVLARGEQVVSELLVESSVSAFWVNFPDPWPKKRHSKNRLIQAPFVRALAERLVPGGVLRLATDDPNYALQMNVVLSAESLLENCHSPLPWLSEEAGRVHTAYEDEWRAEGRALHFFMYRRH